jgi:uncharacterized MnhB-related membrane protein
MLNLLVGIGVLACAVLAVRENRLLVSALWLALTSALVSVLMYRLGAAEVAVVELSVGAGLVTVLFVFAINIAGDEKLDIKALVPKPLAWVVVVIAGLLLAWMILPTLQLDRFTNVPVIDGAIRSMLWQNRSVDMLLQVVLIFSGVLAVLGLIGGKQSEGEEHL